MQRHRNVYKIEACNKEAEKIDSLINYASPTLISHVPLSAFLSSEVSPSSTYSSGGAPSSPLPQCSSSSWASSSQCLSLTVLVPCSWAQEMKSIMKDVLRGLVTLHLMCVTGL
ncbi:hypothetical protein F7725_028398 [Dissostichus mawsoni]|uniref:Uncharacterized protein n=1 Tax=Dissostichus mawsoni TaxID=36200 RepID=A0A7J5XFW2_DISMA|nr:hypothetical protein F7725_028398 [Dissostichus mawsoni]